MVIARMALSARQWVCGGGPPQAGDLPPAAVAGR